MKNKITQHNNFIKNLIFPAVIFGGVSGALTAFFIVLYKLVAKHATKLSDIGYNLLKENLYILIPLIPILFFVAMLLSYIYRKDPNLKGGGIPASIGMIKGKIHFDWLRNFIGTFVLSILSFLIGVPLGTEGPSVLMGTVLGKASSSGVVKKYRAWDRYTMTGGASAGFSVATGAPISGILFAVEEAHQRVSPMIIIVTAFSVMSAQIVSRILSPVFGVNEALFEQIELISISVEKLWVPLLIGVAFGLFSVGFLKYYKFLSKLLSKVSDEKYSRYKIFVVYLLTVGAGIFSHSFISTGHHLTETLFDVTPTIYMLALILIIRTTLTLSANITGVTGGLFLPILAIGATLSGLLAKLGIMLGLDEGYYAVIVALGIGSCVAGMMKMPITAIAFSVEVLSCYNNLLPLIISITVSFVITEIFRAESINDHVLESRIKAINKGRECLVKEENVTVQKGSFAAGKEIRDIFWPENLLILSMISFSDNNFNPDVHGGITLREGDVLKVRYSTYDVEDFHDELYAVVGSQCNDEKLSCDNDNSQKFVQKVN